ncbi:hypothetical protein [Desulfatitalea tepidiphila]|jgi:hypothetical protein|uniref:hypothetical protein n=1 Tax=Desulfatitalea tepidiphila TaxID=1185843 RepID=UPI0006B6680A|nr:hypothetical protein [Desulfatitalea tepidiphila]
MPYDANKDEVIKQWRCDETGLLISIQRYDGGEAKVQIGPRILRKKDGSERAPAKAGRLTIEDLMFLYDIIDEIKEEMTKRVGPG